MFCLRRNRSRFRGGYGIKQRHIVHIGKFRQFVHRYSAQRTFRHIDYAQQADCVLRIVDKTQIGQNVFNFLAVVEFEPADHSVRYARVHEAFFQRARLSVGAVQYCHVAVRGIEQRFLLYSFAGDEIRLVAFIACRIVNDFFALRIIRPELFWLAVDIVFNDAVGGV